MVLLESIAVDRVNDSSQKNSELGDQRLILLVVRAAKQIMVHISNQMYQTLLLLTRYRVISAVEIRNENPGESAQQLV